MLSNQLARFLAPLLLLVLTSGAAFAQQPPAKESDDPYARAQQQRQIAQPGNNAPVWKEVRSGLPQFTTVPGRETNVLVQSQGQTWRAVRVPIYATGGFVFSM